MDFTQNFRLVANVTVGQKTNEAQPLRVVREIQGSFDAFNHHRAAFAVERAQVFPTATDVLGCRGHGPGAECGGVGRKADELEGVERLEPVQGPFDCGLRLRQRAARHAAGAIENEDQFQRLPAELIQFLRRIKHQREIAAAFITVGEQARFDSFTGDLVAQDEILVRNAVVRIERDHEPLRRDGFLRHVVCPADGLFDSHAGVDIDS